MTLPLEMEWNGRFQWLPRLPLPRNSIGFLGGATRRWEEDPQGAMGRMFPHFLNTSVMFSGKQFPSEQLCHPSVFWTTMLTIIDEIWDKLRLGMTNKTGGPQPSCRNVWQEQMPHQATCYQWIGSIKRKWRTVRCLAMGSMHLNK